MAKPIQVRLNQDMKEKIKAKMKLKENCPNNLEAHFEEKIKISQGRLSKHLESLIKHRHSKVSLGINEICEDA